MSKSNLCINRRNQSSCHFLILAIVLLTGSCINVDQEVILSSDGSGSMKVVITAEQAFYESEDFGTTGYEIADVLEEITYLEGFNLVNDREYSSEGMHIWESNYTFKDILKLGNDDFFVTFEPSGDIMVLKMDATLVRENNPGFTKEELATEEVQTFLQQMGDYHFKFQVTVPGPIKDAPRAKVAGRTAAWKIPLDRVFNPQRKTMRMRVVYQEESK
jgi:hypothetical protein